MKKTTLKWRLGKLPTSEEVIGLVKANLLTEDEAKDILFNKETEEEVETDNLKSEIKFLREIIQKLSTPSKISETIKIVERPYYNLPWYINYQTYSLNDGNSNIALYSTNGILSTNSLLVSGTTSLSSQVSGTTGTSSSINFTDIKTF